MAPRQFSWAVLLTVSGALLSAVGLLGGLAAKRSADIASFVASQPTRALTPGPSAPISSWIALNFDPSSAHYVPADYTAFWIGMVVVALGLIVVMAGIGIASAKRHAA